MIGPYITHKRTRRLRLQANGKVERFNRILATEWAYADTYRSDEARSGAFPALSPSLAITADPTPESADRYPSGITPSLKISRGPASQRIERW